ncbi:MAG: GGDEF domain-containing protein [Bilophila wadsworthia]
MRSSLVESGITSILDRKSHQIEAYKRSVVYHMKELGASIAVVFLIALMWIWYGMKKVSQPLRETTLFAHRVAEGEAESSIAVSGHDEIAELRAMLNVMLSSLQKNALMLRELSYIDPLTALWNRRRFREVLSDELRRVQEEKGKGFGLAFIDVDCFKGINDTFGHAAGDMVLREFAKLARGMLPDSATFARLGGDESCALPDADEGLVPPSRDPGGLYGKAARPCRSGGAFQHQRRRVSVYVFGSHRYARGERKDDFRFVPVCGFRALHVQAGGARPGDALEPGLFISLC